MRFCLFLFSAPFIARVLSPTALVRQVTAPPGTPGGMKTQRVSCQAEFLGAPSRMDWGEGREQRAQRTTQCGPARFSDTNGVLSSHVSDSGSRG